MSDTLDHRIALTPKQFDFVNDRTSWEIMYSGAFRAGKSRALCVRAMTLARHPRSKVGMARKTLKSFRDTTLRTLLEPDGDLPPVLPEGSYSHNKNDCRIRLHSGGVIDYFGCEDAEGLGSLFFSDLCLDEAIQFSKKEYDWLIGRYTVSYSQAIGNPFVGPGSGKVPSERHTNTLAIATNPGDPSHFLYDRFFVKRNERRRVIHTASYENTYLSPQTIESLSELTGVSRERYYEGRWVSFDGSLVVPGLRECVVAGVPFDVSRIDPRERVGGIDFGFNDPTAILTGVYRDGVLWVIACHRAARCLSAEHAGNVWDQHTYYCDPAGTQAREDLASEVRRLGGTGRLRIAPRGKGAVGTVVEAEWETVRRFVSEGRLWIVDGAEHQLCLEADNLTYGESTGKVNQFRNDTYGHFDCLDALRYMVAGCERSVGELAPMIVDRAPSWREQLRSV